ncbi:MAG: HEAT repeat domain-containing protein, partial [Trichodesmium sp. St17_bin3_1_1]|nr:HEAT repeat domain-containing protein [Trichodesmium sp. St17_bin3_1_1]
EELLARGLIDGINKLEQNTSLVIFFDTYEIIGSRKCEDAVRRVIRGTNETIIWVIAGRFNLAKNTWRNEEVKLALFDILEKELKNHSADKKAEAANSDIVKAAIKSLAGYDPGLEVKQLIKFLSPLEKKHSDRFVRETAVRELGNLIDSNVSPEILLQAVEPIVQTLRKDDISQVRDAAKESLQQIYFVLDPIYKDKLNSPELPPEFILAKNTWERENSKEEEVNKFYQNILPSEVKLASNKSQMAELLTEFLHQDKDLDVRAAVARELGQQGSPAADTAIQKLIDALDYSNKNSDRYLREEAAKALSKLTPRVNIVDALNKSNRQDVISSVRQAAKEALKSIARKDNSIGKRAQRYLDLMDPDKRQPQETSVENSIITLETLSNIGNLSDEQVDKLIEAAQIVGNHPEPKFINDATQKLIKVLENKKQDPSVVAAVANSLGKIGNFPALECLLSKLEDIKSGDRVARQFVVTGLGNLQSKLSQEGQNAKLETVIDTLIDMWRNDAISSVRNAVEPAIREIYKTTRHPIAYKALKRYPNYEKEDVEEFYEKFFNEFPLN